MAWSDWLNPIKVIGSAFELGDTVGSRLGLWKSESEEMMDDQKDFQREMAALQQKYWYDQFDAVNKYNNPSAAVNRYLRAGVAPSAGFTSSTVGQTSATPSMGAGGSPIPYPPTLQNFAQKFSTIAQGMASLGSAYKSTQEGKRTAALMGEELTGLQMDNSMKQFRFELDKKNLPKKLQAEIQGMLAQANKDIALASVYNEDELLKMEQRFNEIAKRAGIIAESNMLSQESLHWLQTYKTKLDEARSRISANKASATASYANARFSDSQATRENYFNRLRADPGVRHSLQTALLQEGDKAIKQNQLTGAQAAQYRELVKKLAFANSVQEFEYAWQKLKDIGDFATKAIDSVVPF